MRKLFGVISLMLLFAGSAFAQFQLGSISAVEVKNTRFNASVSADKAKQQAEWTYNALLVASKTDTSDWFYFDNVKGPNYDGFRVVDTLLEAGVKVPTADSMKASFAVQWGQNGIPTGTTRPIDSINYGAFDAVATTEFRVKASRVVFTARPNGANCARLIVSTAATGNDTTDRYFMFFVAKLVEKD